ncbi:receptor-like protein EIX2 [Gossypium raimondii]|uniref:Leucine-rich repeat-containing N-terminal plant-type domain-containing protein n=1 Tax=Gossypium raimondii TaxID=29730 RepID=A0A7J8NNV9_GOSRA|nr:receptor-like protein EIX2 [Gossypium raimondii]MBA0578648.1 hypothetical protein [Gossypium raimondii]
MANLESSIATIMLGYVYPDIYGINSNIVKYGGFFDDHLGEIPQEIASLQGLISLNLSRNTLSGCIIREIGQLKAMESLDLSTNNLSGEISKSMFDLYFLCVLDLSNNNLFRRIPLSTQLQSFDATSYSGNPRLCRTPLKKCPGNELPKSPKNSNIENRSESDKGLFEPVVFTGMATGFFVGFWGAFVSLLINKSLRHGYFQLVKKLGDWIRLSLQRRV